MRTLSNFLAGLPGIRPIKARRLILNGDLLSKDERVDIFERDRSLLDTVVEVGPDAAAAILKAYKNGRLPMQKNASPAATRRERLRQSQADGQRVFRQYRPRIGLDVSCRHHRSQDGPRV